LNHCVVDASVALKWYVPEPYSENALRLLESHLQGDLALHVPDLFLAESGNILWKKVQRGELSGHEAGEISRALLSVPKTVYPTEILLPAAVRLACALGRTVYDSLYLALAALVDCPMITADQRLYRALGGTEWSVLLRWVGDL